MIDLTAELTDLRALAEARMDETWVFERANGQTTVDEHDSDVDEYAVVHTSIGRLDTGDTQARETEAGPATVTTTNPVLNLPVTGTPDVRAGDRATCTQAGPGSDPALVGVPFYVIATPVASQKTARRWPVRRWEA
jgi:hypothetical protein